MKTLTALALLLALQGCAMRAGNPVFDSIARTMDAQDPCQGKSLTAMPDFCGRGSGVKPKYTIRDNQGRRVGTIQ